MNYNLPSHADGIYEKLIKDGFNKNNVILVDNGSDKADVAKNTTMRLPWNIRVTGQMKMSMDYLLDYFPEDYYLYISTSASLYDDINYKQVIDYIIDDLSSQNVAMIASSLSGGLYKNFPTQNHDLLKYEYSIVGLLQPMMVIYEDRFLRSCRNNNIGCYNPSLIRGHGIDTEMRFFADKINKKCIVARDMHIEWLTNHTHVLGLADEPRSQYKAKARKEAVNAFYDRYGKNWRSKVIDPYNIRKILKFEK